MGSNGQMPAGQSAMSVYAVARKATAGWRITDFNQMTGQSAV